MNSIERVIKTVGFEQADRVPVIAQVGGHSAILSGRRLIEYVKSGEVAAESQINALRYYGYDAVLAIFDACVETEAAGSVIDFHEDIYPTVGKYAFDETSDFSHATLPDPYSSGRMPELLKCVRTLRKEVGDSTVVVGTVIGPTTVATQLVGMEKCLYLAIDHPERFEALMSYATQLVIDFGVAQLAEGAHVILIFDPSASQTVVPPQFYREFILPQHKAVFDAMKRHGSAANWLHSAGNIAEIMPYYKEAGVTIANFDWEMKPEAVKELLPGICVDGNITPLDFVTGTPESIYAKAKELLNMFKDRGGFILSSGCEIPPEAKPENVKAMVEAAKE